MTDIIAFRMVKTPVLHVGSNDLQSIQRFKVVLYSRVCGLGTVHEARKHMFALESRSLENIPRQRHHSCNIANEPFIKVATYGVKHSSSTLCFPVHWNSRWMASILDDTTGGIKSLSRAYPMWVPNSLQRPLQMQIE